MGVRARCQVQWLDRSAGGLVCLYAGADFTGVLQADAFAGYAELYRSGRIREAGCMAHARRKLHDLHAVRPSSITTEALERIGALYRIEEHIRGKPLEERRHIRQTQAAPLLDELKQWFEATQLTLSAKSDTTKAIQYALNRWPALAYYCSDGQAEIDNLIAERGVARCRNWQTQLSLRRC
ncbi:hypothetical protein P3T23_009771 [Paraburkholderia sp. GAS448]